MFNEEPSRQYDVEITLVPGTWFWLGLPRTLKWFDKGSDFRNQLDDFISRAGLHANIHTHSWSGANSIFQRAKAAASLARLLRNRRRDNPNTIQFVIGHSHGGTVAMLLTRFLPAHLMPHLVTMATPFMEIAPKDASALELFAVLAAIIFLDTIIHWKSFELFTGPYTSEFITPYPLVETILTVFVALTLFLALGYVLLVVLVGPLFKKTRKTLASKLHKATLGGLTMKKGYRIFVIRGIDDEASLTLAFGALANRLSTRLSRVLFAYSPFLVLAFTRTSSWFYVAVILSYALLLFSNIVKSVYGLELIVGSLLLQVKSDSSPDQIEQATIV
jgi:hypothetical protein